MPVGLCLGGNFGGVNRVGIDSGWISQGEIYLDGFS